MKKIVFSMLALALMITACNSAATPAPVATQNSTAAASPAPATSTSEVTVQPAQNADGKVQVQVSEGDNWVKSDLTTFKVGVPYVFTVTNTGRRAHIFAISNPVKDITFSGMDAAMATALLMVSKDQLTPGATVTVEYTFTKPAPAGTLEFACLILMHYKMGQYLPIVVE